MTTGSGDHVQTASRFVRISGIVLICVLHTGCGPAVEVPKVSESSDLSATKMPVPADRQISVEIKARSETSPAGNTLVGRVVDEAGKPVAGAEIRLGHYETKNVAAITDTDGRFSLDPGSPAAHSILFSAPGKAIELIRLRQDRHTNNIDVTLKQGQTLRVRVPDSDGNPIPGAHVSGDDWRGSAILIHFKTNEDGLIEWNEAPEDAVEYFVTSPGMKYCRRSNLPLVANGSIHDVTLSRAIEVFGQVRDAETLLPIEHFSLNTVSRFESGSMVTYRSPPREFRDGKFVATFFEEKESHGVRIEAEGYRSQMTQPVGELVVDLQKAEPLAFRLASEPPLTVNSAVRECGRRFLVWTDPGQQLRRCRQDATATVIRPGRWLCQRPAPIVRQYRSLPMAMVLSVSVAACWRGDSLAN